MENEIQGIKVRCERGSPINVYFFEVFNGVLSSIGLLEIQLKIFVSY